jgi:hypothetical protein
MPAARWGATLNVACEGVDISCDIVAIDVQRGRTRLWDPMAAATAAVQINVGTGSTQPHTRGPIGASMVIDLSYGTINRHLFTGSVQLRQVESTPAGTILTLDCVDGFEFLSRQNHIASPSALPVGAGETITDRIGRWLDVAGWTLPRALDTTVDTCPEVVIDGNALAEIQRTVLADGGDFYIDEAGTATFKSYDWRNTVHTVDAIFSDQYAYDWVPYSTSALRDDLDEIQNDVRGQRRTFTGDVAPRFVQVASNPSSITAFGHRGDALKDLELEDDTQVVNRVAKVVQVAAASSTRFDPVVVQPELKPARSWPKVLRVHWGSLVATNRTWRDGSVSAFYGHVIGEHWRLDANDATVTFRISGTQTWDSLVPPRPPLCLVFNQATGKWCAPLGCPCSATFPVVTMDCTTGEINGTFPAGSLCYCETGGGIIVPDNTCAIGFDDGSGTIIWTPIDDRRQTAVLWFMVLDATFEMYEQIDNEPVIVGPGFDHVSPATISGGQAVNATTTGGVVGGQDSAHVAATAFTGGWNIDWWMLIPVDLTAHTTIIDLQTIQIAVLHAGAGDCRLQVSVQDAAGLLHLSGPLYAVPVESVWHHWIVTWDPSGSLSVILDGVTVV